MALIKLVKEGTTRESVVELSGLDGQHKRIRDKIIGGNLSILDLNNLDGLLGGGLGEWSISIEWEDYEGEESEGECEAYWRYLSKVNNY